MGSVWQAQDLTLNAQVAVKLIDPAIAESPQALARFQREAQAAAAIRSSHVVQTLDYGVDAGRPFIAMELLNGESLADRLTRLGQLSPDDVAHIMGHVGRALAIAHRNDIVHRDLKPENIFVVREEDDEVAKVLDFGIARRQSKLGESDSLKTQTGALLGTPYYMSPEQATGQPVDCLSDIWSFGVIAFECLTGRRTFNGDSLGALFHSVCIAEMPVPSRLHAVPAGFDAWFARCTARDKQQRFQSIKEAADGLRQVCGHALAISLPKPPTAPAPGTSETAPAPATLGHTVPPAALTIPGLPKRNVGLMMLVGVPLIVIVAVVLFFGWRRTSSPTVVTPSSATLAAASIPLLPVASTAKPPETPHTQPDVVIRPSLSAEPTQTPSPTVSAAPAIKDRPAPGGATRKPKAQAAPDSDNVAAF
jgi:serine/threonine-protein kinase